jgi:hypothetical protein
MQAYYHQQYFQQALQQQLAPMQGMADGNRDQRIMQHQMAQQRIKPPINQYGDQNERV